MFHPRTKDYKNQGRKKATKRLIQKNIQHEYYDLNIITCSRLQLNSVKYIKMLFIGMSSLFMLLK